MRRVENEIRKRFSDKTLDAKIFDYDSRVPKEKMYYYLCDSVYWDETSMNEIAKSIGISLEELNCYGLKYIRNSVFLKENIEIKKNAVIKLKQYQKSNFSENIFENLDKFFFQKEGITTSHGRLINRKAIIDVELDTIVGYAQNILKYDIEPTISDVVKEWYRRNDPSKIEENNDMICYYICRERCYNTEKIVEYAKNNNLNFEEILKNAKRYCQTYYNMNNEQYTYYKHLTILDNPYRGFLYKSIPLFYKILKTKDIAKIIELVNENVSIFKQVEGKYHYDENNTLSAIDVFVQAFPYADKNKVANNIKNKINIGLYDIYVKKCEKQKQIKDEERKLKVEKNREARAELKLTRENEKLKDLCLLLQNITGEDELNNSIIKLLTEFLDSGESAKNFCISKNIDLRVFEQCRNLIKETNQEFSQALDEKIKNNNLQRYAILIKTIKNIISSIKNDYEQEDGTIRKFDVLDYFDKTKIKYDEALRIIQGKINSDQLYYFRRFMKENNIGKIWDEKDIYSYYNSQIKYNVQFDKNRRPISGTGEEFSLENKKAIINYLFRTHVPICDITVRTAQKRYINQQLNIFYSNNESDSIIEGKSK